MGGVAFRPASVRAPRLHAGGPRTVSVNVCLCVCVCVFDNPKGICGGLLLVSLGVGSTQLGSVVL